MFPNQTLRRARILHGWSQSALATKLGTSPKNVSRWERGYTFPSPYYRERLCQLFEVDAQVLGLLPPSQKDTATNITNFPAVVASPTITGSEQEVLNLLVSCGLIEPIDNQSYHIHQILVDYAYYYLKAQSSQVHLIHYMDKIHNEQSKSIDARVKELASLSDDPLSFNLLYPAMSK